MDTKRMLAAVLFLCAATAHAEEPLRLPAGARVRVSSASGDRGVDGLLLGVDEGRIRLALPSPGPWGSPSEIAVKRDGATRVQVHRGTKRHTLIGTLAGALAMGLAGATFTVDRRTCELSSSSAFCSRGEAIAAGALTGALLGAIVGHSIERDQWSSPVVLAP